MWYVIWTSTGSERKAQELIGQKSRRCFFPTRKINKKIKGEWKTEIRPLFPGYVFADTDDIEELSNFLRQAEGFNKVLDTDKEFYSLYGDDESFIENIYNNDGLFDVSKAVVEGDNVRVTAGPLVGMEGSITKIDRHKRTAYLKLNMFGQVIRTSVGLEVVE